MFSKKAKGESLQKTIDALKNNGISSIVVQSAAQAKEKIIEIIPEGAEVMTMTSITLLETGIEKEINGSGRYDSVKAKLSKMNRETQSKEMQRLGAAPEWTIGSVHAVTENGQVMIASNTGSQLPAYAYGANHVIWVVGTQKIVSNLDEGTKRIYDYVLPKETVRARAAYGLDESFHSFVSKLLIFNREVTPNRITIIFIEESIGF